MMPPRNSPITDELLSAYIDEAVTAEERLLVETAVAAEPAVAWRLETLRQTVQLLRTLPEIVLSRSFALSQLPVVAGPEELVTVKPAPVRSSSSTPQPHSWLAALGEAWRGLWQMGSPLLRNAAAASFALFLVLMLGDLAATGFTPRLFETGAGEVLTLVTPAATPAQPAAQAPAATATTPAETPVTPTAAPQRTTSARQTTNRAADQASIDQAETASATTGVMAGADIQAAEVQATARDRTERNTSQAPGPDESQSPFEGAVASDSEDQTQVAESMGAVLAAEKITTSTESAEEAVSDVVDDAATSTSARTVAPTVAAYSARDGESMATPFSGPVATQPAVATLTRPAAIASPPPWLPALEIAQIAAALLTLLFASLWWRSRAQPADGT